jgi:hypothetical protein
LAPKGAGILKQKVFWRQKARVILRLKIRYDSITVELWYITAVKSFITLAPGERTHLNFRQVVAKDQFWHPGVIVIKLFLSLTGGQNNLRMFSQHFIFFFTYYFYQ